MGGKIWEWHNIIFYNLLGLIAKMRKILKLSKTFLGGSNYQLPSASVGRRETSLYENLLKSFSIFRFFAKEPLGPKYLIPLEAMGKPNYQIEPKGPKTPLIHYHFLRPLLVSISNLAISKCVGGCRYNKHSCKSYFS